MTAGTVGSSGVSRSQDSNPAGFELTLLEVENERLREQAEALLRRQQVLEDLAMLHRLIARQGGQLVWTPTATAADGKGLAASFDRLEAAVAQSSSSSEQQ